MSDNRNFITRAIDGDEPVITQTMIMALVGAVATFIVMSLRMFGVDPPGWWLEAGWAVVVAGAPLVWVWYRIRPFVRPDKNGSAGAGRNPTE